MLAYAVVVPVLGFQLAEVHVRGIRGLLAAIKLASVVSVAALMARLMVPDTTPVRLTVLT